MKWITSLAVLCCLAVAAIWLAGSDHYETSIVIDKPRQVVFAALLNPEMTLKWVSGVKEIKQLTPEFGKVGSKLMLVGKRGEVFEEITHLEPPYMSQYTSFRLGGQSTEFGEHRLEEVNGQTKLISVSKIECNGFFSRLIEPLLAWRARHKMEGDQKALKAIMEFDTKKRI